MAFKLINISNKTLKTGIPLSITFNDGFTTKKIVVAVGESISMMFVPKTAHAFQLRNLLKIENITNDVYLNDLLNSKKEIVIEQPIIPSSIIPNGIIENTEIIDKPIKKGKKVSEGDVE